MFICDYWLYGYTVLQIMFESLPVSSSGHVLLVQRALARSLPERFLHAYDYALHGATLLVLLFYFSPRIYRYFCTCSFTTQLKTLFQLLFLVGLATTSTVIVWVLYNLYVPDMTWFIPYGFLVTAFLLGSLYYVPKKQTNIFGYAYPVFVAIVLGFVQGMSLLPGISRLASTYVAGRWLGQSPEKSFYASCALQVPLCAAGFLRGVVCLYKSAYVLGDVNYWFLGLSLLGACIGAYLLLWLTETIMRTQVLWVLSFYEFLVAFVAFFML